MVLSVSRVLLIYINQRSTLSTRQGFVQSDLTPTKKPKHRARAADDDVGDYLTGGASRAVPLLLIVI